MPVYVLPCRSAKTFRCLVSALGVFAFNAGAIAQETNVGEQTYKTTCIACHQVGINNAPKLGDKAAWAPLIKEGQDVLTAHAWVGVRAMPPKGGNPDLSLEDFSSAVAYMARAAGGSWQHPDAAMLEEIREEEAKRIKQLSSQKSS